MAYLTEDEFYTRTKLLEADYPRTSVAVSLTLAQAIIEEATRQWFEPRAVDFFFDGNGTSLAQFSVPIIEVDALYLNNEKTPSPRSLWRAATGRGGPRDERRNPKIQLVTHTSYVRDIYSAPFPGGTPVSFMKGPQNQRVVGTFGFTEVDGSPPPLILHAVTKLALYNLGALELGATAVAIPALPAQLGNVKSESTDGHSISYEVAPRAQRKVGLSGILHSDTELEDIVRMYRAPRAIAVSGTSFISHEGV